VTEHAQRPIGRRIQAGVMRVINVPMRFLLGLPVRTPLSERLMLVSYTGRKTGKAYRQPVSYVQQADTLLTPGGGQWKWNLRDGQPVRICLRGRDLLARPELVKDPNEVEHLLAAMAAVNPRTYAFVGIPRGPDGRLDRARLEAAIRNGFRIVRWRLGNTAI
jgi:deazaflavin-dependent oxidoreductase (nitroreductase family)